MEKLASYIHKKSIYLILAATGGVLLGCIKILPSGYLYGISTFISLVIFLVLTMQAETKCDYIVAGVFFILGYIFRFLGTTGSIILDIIICSLLGVVIYSIFIVNRIIIKRQNNTFQTLAFPSLWMAFAFILAAVRFPAVMRLEWLFFDMNYLIQSVSLITVYGFSFFILWMASLLSCAITKKSISQALIAGGILLLMTGFGIIKITAAPELAHSIKVAYSTGPYIGDFITFIPTSYDEYIACLDQSVRNASDGKAEILTFNEEAFIISDINEEDFIAHAKMLARENHIHILLGMQLCPENEANETKSQNRLVWIDSEGNEKDTYLKFETIPFLESDILRGDGKIPVIDITVNGETVHIAYAICYDSNHLVHMNQINNKVDILFLPSWDWDGVDEFHYRLCGSLAVELGISIIKPTYDGYTLVSDPYGHIVKLTHTNDIGFGNVQFVDIPF